MSAVGIVSRRLAMAMAAAVAGLWGMGCSSLSIPAATSPGGQASWQGRLAWQEKDRPSQSFSANFELRGDPQQGMLQLLSPLGGVVLDVRWSEDGAWLRTSGQTERYDRLQALTSQHAGQQTSVRFPIETLFDWLDGKPTHVEGWTVDLDRLPQGRLTARRDQPSAELRVILDSP